MPTHCFSFTAGSVGVPAVQWLLKSSRHESSKRFEKQVGLFALRLDLRGGLPGEIRIGDGPQLES